MKDMKDKFLVNIFKARYAKKILHIGIVLRSLPTNYLRLAIQLQAIFLPYFILNISYQNQNILLLVRSSPKYFYQCWTCVHAQLHLYLSIRAC